MDYNILQSGITTYYSQGLQNITIRDYDRLQSEITTYNPNNRLQLGL